MLLMEWNIQSMDLKSLREDFDLGYAAKDTAIGAGVLGAAGAGLGALGSGAPWVIKRLKLQKALKSCNGDAKCEKSVRSQIEELNTQTKSNMKKGAIVGGGVGAGMGVMSGIRHGFSADPPTIETPKISFVKEPQRLASVSGNLEQPSNDPAVRQAASQILQGTSPNNDSMQQTKPPAIDLQVNSSQPQQSMSDVEGPSRRTSALPKYQKFFGPHA